MHIDTTYARLSLMLPFHYFDAAARAACRRRLPPRHYFADITLASPFC